MDLLREACRTVKQWQVKFPHYSKLMISVNLSAKQFQHPTLIADIKNILQDTGLDGSCLKLEVTESVFIDDFNFVGCVTVPLPWLQGATQLTYVVSWRLGSYLTCYHHRIWLVIKVRVRACQCTMPA